MKKLIAVIGLVTCLTLASEAQTNTLPVPAPAQTIWDFATTLSNYWAAPFATMATDGKSFGGGFALGANVSPLVNPVIRLDYFDGRVYMGSLTANLQAPRQLFGKFPLIPFGIAGVGTPFAGAGGNNGSLVTILGAGAALKFDSLGSSWIAKHTDFVIDYENWGGLPSRLQNQIRLGFLVKF